MPANLIVPLAEINVPLLLQLPFTVVVIPSPFKVAPLFITTFPSMIAAALILNIPVVTFKLLLIVAAVFNDPIPADLLITKLL